jgi:spermidine synthase
VLGGGAGGVIGEILKHPSVSRVDYVEPDPWLLRLIARHAATLSARELADPRVRRHETDARRFVRTSPDRYDVILLGAPLPLTLQGNRLYTAEFFAAARQLLAADGLLAVTASGSLTYYGPELGQVNATLLATLKKVFPAVTVVPGDENLYLAGIDRVTLDPALLTSRLRERGLVVQLISPEHLVARLDPALREWFSHTMGQLSPELNRDHTPRLLLWHLGYRSRQFDPVAGRFFAWLGSLSAMAVLIGAGSVALVLALGGRQRRRGVLGAMVVTGFGGMLLELVLTYAWQVLQGAIYQSLALLITTFMAGLALGSWLANGQLDRGGNPLRLFRLGEASMVMVALVVAATPVGIWAASALPTAMIAGILLLQLALVGRVVGAQFPLAVRLLAAEGESSPASTGAVYGADLLGAWLGGMVGGVVLLPALGMVPACLVVVLLKVGSWLGVCRT